VSDEKDVTPSPDTPPAAAEEQVEPTAPTSRFPELEVLQQDIERRIRDNRKFLEGFLDDDYVDEDEVEEDEDSPDDFEEL